MSAGEEANNGLRADGTSCTDQTADSPNAVLTEIPNMGGAGAGVRPDESADNPERALSRIRAWALPVADGSGIACDGEFVWLLSEGALLQRIHLPTAEITRTHTVDLGLEAGSQAFGIELVGDQIWISVAGHRNAIVVVDAESGELIKTWSSPTQLGPSDLAISEEGVWLADGTGGIYLLDRANASGLWESGLPDPQRDHGIAAKGELIVIGNLFGGLWLHRRSDLRVVAELVDETGKSLGESRVGAMCFEGERLRILSGRGVEEFALPE